MLTDEAVLRFLLPNETAGHFFERIQAEQQHTGLSFVDDRVSIRPGTVLEVAGPHGSGKTEFLIHMAVGALLPRTSADAARMLAEESAAQQAPRSALTSTAPRPLDTWRQASVTQAAAANTGGRITSSLQQAPMQHDQQSHNLNEGQQQGQPLQTTDPLVHVPAAGRQDASWPAVVWFDCDGKFDIQRVAQVLHQRFLKLLHVGPAPTAGMAASLSTAATWMGSYEGTPAQTRPFHQRDSHAQADMLVLHCLRRLALIRCDSSMQLLAALLALRQGTWQAQSGAPIRLLLIDSVGAFQWRDKAVRAAVGAIPTTAAAALDGASAAVPRADQTPLGPGQGGQGPLLMMPTHLEVQKALAALLPSLCQQLRAAVLASKHVAVSLQEGVTRGSGWSHGSAGQGLQQREYMLGPWQGLVTARVVLLRRGLCNPSLLLQQRGAGATPNPLPHASPGSSIHSMHITGQASSSALHNQATLLLAEFQEGGLSASSGSWQGRAGQGGDGEEARVSLCMGLAQLVVLDGGVYESQTRFYGT